MLELLGAADGLEWVKRQLRTHQRASLIVAFWGEGATEALGLDNRGVGQSDVHVICNLSLGGTNPNEIKKLLALPGVSVSQCDHLHAKVYLFDDSAMIGSSDALANALSLEGSDTLSWHEANLVTRDAATLAAIGQWKEALPIKPVTSNDLVLAQKAWKARRKSMPAGGRDRSIRTLLEQGTHQFSGHDLFLALTAGELTEEGAAALEQQRGDLPAIDAWENWDDLPKVGTFVTFQLGVDGSYEFENCFKRSDIPDRPSGRNRNSLQWCFPAKPPLGIKSPGEEEAEWNEIITLVLAQKGPVAIDRPVLVTFEDLQKLWSAR